MKVLIAIDDSPHSERLIDVLAHRHWPENTQFKIMAVLEPVDFRSDKEQWQDVIIEAGERRKNAAEERCQSARHKLSDKIEHANVHYELREGDPRGEIIDAASEWHADKIILGAHSKSVCPHNLLGSVSRAVAAHAPCSVEIIRDKSKTAVVV